MKITGNYRCWEDRKAKGRGRKAKVQGQVTFKAIKSSSFPRKLFNYLILNAI